MKTIILAIISVMIFQSSYAQENSLAKGKLYFGGTLGFSNYINNNETEFMGASAGKSENHFTKFKILPSVGYFLSDNISVELKSGLLFNRTSSKTDAPNSENVRESYELQFIPNFNYFKPLGSEKFGFMLSLNLLAGLGQDYSKNSSLNQNSLEKDREYYRLGTHLVPNLFYFPTKKLSLTLGVGDLISIDFKKVKSENNGSVNRSSDNSFKLLNFENLDLVFGCNYYF